MSLTSSDCIAIITGAARLLSAEEWSLIDLTLKEFHLPWTDNWSGDKNSYVIEMLTDASDDSLVALAHHVGFELESSASGIEPTILATWPGINGGLSCGGCGNRAKLS